MAAYVRIFATLEQASAEGRRMAGWKIKVVKFYHPESLKADKDGNVYAIECDGSKYLRTDGHVA